MPLKLVIESLAETDVETIFEYIHRRNPDGALNWYQAFLAAAERTVQMPESYPLAPENVHLDRDVRNFLFKTRRGLVYRGVFVVIDDKLRGLRVLGPGQPRVKKSELSLE